jgi:HEAT repeat protein
LVDFLYAENDRARSGAAAALLFFDPEMVKQSLLQALRTRGPRDRMVFLLTRNLGSDRVEVSRQLVRWLVDFDSDTRAAAVDGLYHINGNHSPDPEVFGALAAMLRDPVANVRRRAAYSVGAYADAPALSALKPVVRDSNVGVSEQATIAVGWVASRPDADPVTRNDAIQVLRQVAQTAGAPAKQATYWLQKVGER